MSAQQSPAQTTRFFKSPWFYALCFISILVSIPVLTVFTLALNPDENIWPHLLNTVLPIYLNNTVQLMLGVGVFTLVFGISTAWLVSMCEFPGRKIFEWALLLPFSIPAYVIAYVYTDLFEYAGHFQTGLRALFGWQSGADYWFPEIRSMGGAIIMLSLVLYPYIYLTTRAAFLSQSQSLFIASRSLGKNGLQSFFNVSLPIARPAVAVGLSLVLMETLNDFGTVDFFAVHTLTAGLYDTWLNMNNLPGAAQIASLMLIFVMTLISLERFSRRKQKLFEGKNTHNQWVRFQLKGPCKWAATLLCSLLVLFGFLIPFLTLCHFSWLYFDESWTPDFIQHAFNSLSLATTASIVTLIFGITLAYTKRLFNNKTSNTLVQFSTLGYAMPGAVLAIGIIIPFASLDNQVDSLSTEYFGYSTGLILSGTTFAIVFAYVVRFLSMSVGNIESSLNKVTPSMDMASRSLGHPPFKTLLYVHLPIIKGGILTAALMVFVDSLKELPATLILRPFNFETLSTHIYQYASDELLEQSALAGLIIVLAGIIPVILLSKSISSSRN